jgi:hypothetical protein
LARAVIVTGIDCELDLHFTSKGADLPSLSTPTGDSIDTVSELLLVMSTAKRSVAGPLRLIFPLTSVPHTMLAGSSIDVGVGA